MDKLFRAAAGLVTCAIVGYGIKYAVDASDGHYCLPVNGEYAVTRHAASLGNNIVNAVARMAEKPLCPAPPVFVVPPARAARPGNGS